MSMIISTDELTDFELILCEVSAEEATVSSPDDPTQFVLAFRSTQVAGQRSTVRCFGSFGILLAEIANAAVADDLRANLSAYIDRTFSRQIGDAGELAIDKILHCCGQMAPNLPEAGVIMPVNVDVEIKVENLPLAIPSTWFRLDRPKSPATEESIRNLTTTKIGLTLKSPFSGQEWFLNLNDLEGRFGGEDIPVLGRIWYFHVKMFVFAWLAILWVLEACKLCDHLGDCCRICLEDLRAGSDATQMPCSHVYHGECIDRWLRIRRSCPICRFRLNDPIQSFSIL